MTIEIADSGPVVGSMRAAKTRVAAFFPIALQQVGLTKDRLPLLAGWEMIGPMLEYCLLGIASLHLPIRQDYSERHEFLSVLLWHAEFLPEKLATLDCIAAHKRVSFCVASFSRFSSWCLSFVGSLHFFVEKKKDATKS